MRAIMVMFDSLIRDLLPAYGCDWVHTPSFERLARRSVTFDNCYGGSMPCIPARRELHTGRYTFLHRGWGPLEPFDDSVPELLKQSGVHTHLVSDHMQYWDDGGSVYPGRYSTFEFFRGQEGEPWKGQVADPHPPEDLKRARGEHFREGEQWRQDWINRLHMVDEAAHPQTRVFDAGVEFIETNRNQDRWFLQIEAFDPHEPFFTYDRYKRLYPHDYDGPHFDWPDYLPVTEPPAAVDHAKYEYAALLSMCDASLGRVLDAMDEYAMWDDTMLILCTDHGYLLGEHGWWGKVVQPWYDEAIHTPLFIWDPRSGGGGERRRSLVQTLDFGPTLLELFGVALTEDMQGVPLRETIARDAPVRDAGLFGQFGGHVCVTDGRYVYMRASRDETNQPLYEYTLMPTEMFARFPVERLREATLAEPFSFTKGVSTLRIPGHGFRMIGPWGFGTLLYDLETDPAQHRPLVDDELELKMCRLLVALMRRADAPPEQYERLGLPAAGDVGPEHLLARAQLPQVEAARTPALTAADFPDAPSELTVPLQELLERPGAVDALREHAPLLADPLVADAIGPLSLLELAERGPGMLNRPQVDAILADLHE